MKVGDRVRAKHRAFPTRYDGKDGTIVEITDLTMYNEVTVRLDGFAELTYWDQNELELIEESSVRKSNGTENVHGCTCGVWTIKDNAIEMHSDYCDLRPFG